MPDAKNAKLPPNSLDGFRVFKTESKGSDKREKRILAILEKTTDPHLPRLFDVSIMRHFSMFSGVGTAEKGIEQAYEQFQTRQSNSDKNIADTTFGIGNERASKRNGAKSPASNSHKQIRKSGHASNSNGFEVRVRGKRELPSCIGCAEIDKYASAIYKHHWPGVRNFGDATAIIPDGLPDFDLLCAGFPCQTFSVMGKGRGFDDARGTLFFEIARILSHKRPKHFLLENVKNLVGHDNGKTVQRILEILTTLDYYVETFIVNSEDHGVPQHRERVFFVGHKIDRCSEEILSLPESYRGDFETVSGRKSIRGRDKSATGCLDTRGVNAFDRSDLDKILFFENNIRRLTPVEYERLQGLPDDWTKYGLFEDGATKEISDTQRYKCGGNAMTVNVIEAIIGRMIEVGCLS